jgi:hypothetical protein
MKKNCIINYIPFFPYVTYEKELDIIDDKVMSYEPKIIEYPVLKEDDKKYYLDDNNKKVFIAENSTVYDYMGYEVYQSQKIVKKASSDMIKVTPFNAFMFKYLLVVIVAWMLFKSPFDFTVPIAWVLGADNSLIEFFNVFRTISFLIALILIYLFFKINNKTFLIYTSLILFGLGIYLSLAYFIFLPIFQYIILYTIIISMGILIYKDIKNKSLHKYYFLPGINSKIPLFLNIVLKIPGYFIRQVDD